MMITLASAAPTDEAINAPLHALADARAAAGLPQDRFRTFTPGQYLTV
jgi:hypothetical protein